MKREMHGNVRTLTPRLSGSASDQRRQLAELCTWATLRMILVDPTPTCSDQHSDEVMRPLDESEHRTARLLELLLAQSVS